MRKGLWAIIAYLLAVSCFTAESANEAAPLGLFLNFPAKKDSERPCRPLVGRKIRSIRRVILTHVEGDEENDFSFFSKNEGACGGEIKRRLAYLYPAFVGPHTPQEIQLGYNVSVAKSFSWKSGLGKVSSSVKKDLIRLNRSLSEDADGSRAIGAAVFLTDFSKLSGGETQRGLWRLFRHIVKKEIEKMVNFLDEFTRSTNSSSSLLSLILPLNRLENVKWSAAIQKLLFPNVEVIITIDPPPSSLPPGKGRKAWWLNVHRRIEQCRKELQIPSDKISLAVSLGEHPLKNGQVKALCLSDLDILTEHLCREGYHTLFFSVIDGERWEGGCSSSSPIHMVSRAAELLKKHRKR